MRYGLAFALLACVTVARAERPTVVVTAAPPLDAEQLADTLRTYLDGFSIDVRTAPAATGSDLRDQLAATGAAGDKVQALAAIRISGDASRVEIQLIDRLTQKSLVAEVPRSGRDEDFYRSLALKVQALLRSTLYEQPEKVVAVAPTLAPLVLPKPAPAAPRHRLSLEVAYALQAFPLGNVVQHGVALRVRVELARILELSAGIDALAPTTVRRDDVTALFYDIPIVLAADVRLRRPRFEGAAGAVGILDVLLLDRSSPSMPVRSERTVAPALGVELAGRVRLGQPVWLYARAAVLGVLAGERFTVRGQALLDVSGLQVTADAGLGVAVW